MKICFIYYVIALTKIIFIQNAKIIKRKRMI